MTEIIAVKRAAGAAGPAAPGRSTLNGVHAPGCSSWTAPRPSILIADSVARDLAAHWSLKALLAQSVTRLDALG